MWCSRSHDREEDIDNDRRNRYTRTPNAERRTPNAEPQLLPLFSIIVPAYNVEKFIAKALDSLINQDISPRNYEIIITDDGSTDQTPQILDAYAEKFPFIHVTHTENHGPSHARNVALAQARGEYITFCDADDFESPQLLSVLTKALKVHGKPDFLVWHHYTSNDFPAEGFPVYDVQSMSKYESESFDGEELCYRIFLNSNVGGYSWNKAFRSNIIMDIRFDESLINCEDVDWLVNIFMHRKNINGYLLRYYLYCYVHRVGIGLTRSRENTHTEDGLPRHMYVWEKVFSINDFPKRAKDLLPQQLYDMSINSLYAGPVKQSPEVHSKLSEYIHRHMRDYYFSPTVPLMAKAKNFIKHILVLLHINTITAPFLRKTKNFVKHILVLLHLRKSTR